MRRLLTRTLILAAALVTFVLVAKDGQAGYMLDYPHNESNGMKCFNCHNANFNVYTWDDGGDPDNTVSNAICLSCHGPNPTDPNWGPEKALHSHTTTGSTKPAWTTQCIDCHNPHYQGQMDWTVSDQANLYLALVTVNGGVSYDNNPDATPGAAFPDGTSTLTGVTVGTCNDGTSGAGEPSWCDPYNWLDKGGRDGSTRANDGSRGLILVTKIDGLGDDFEITGVSGSGPYTLTLKGNTTGADFSSGVAVYFGGSLRSWVKNPTSGEMRDVKFFSPTIYPGGTGGFVDDAGGSSPVGLCQACHTDTVYWDTDGAESAHNDGANCGSCHDVLTGASGEADHGIIIADAGCVSCHAIYASPEKAHAASCATCHLEYSNNIIIDGSKTPVGEADSLWTNLTGAGYNFNGTGSPRMTDPQADDVASGNFDQIGCSVCHPSRVADHQLAGAHTSPSKLLTSGKCDGCHVNDGSAPDIVTSVHADNCGLCHISIAVPVQIKAGLVSEATCLGCHTDHDANFTTGHQNEDHQSPGDMLTKWTGPATAQSCTLNCHVAADLAAIITDIHNDNCNNCHTESVVDGTLRVGTNGANATLNGDASGHVVGTASDCNNCHSNYAASFFSHDSSAASHDHAGILSYTADGSCEVCHTGSQADIANVIHKGNCSNSCHNSSEGYILMARARGTALNGRGDCKVCHTDHAANWYYHNMDHSATGNITVLPNVAVTPIRANCIGCHTGDAVTGVHDRASAGGTASCQKCHNSDGSNRSYAVSWSGECVNCHGAYFDGHSHTHNVSFNAIVDKTSGNSTCDTCHNTYGLTTWNGIVLTHERDIIDGLNVCKTCHDYDGTNGLYNTTPAVDVTNTISNPGPNTCVDCHTDKAGAHGSHVSTEFAWTVATRASCGDDSRLAGACHDDGTNSDVIAQVHNDNCALCHVDEPNNDYTRIIGVPASNDANAALATSRSAICTDCHTTANFSIPFIHHRNDGSIVFDPATDCTTCHSTGNSAAGDHTNLVANAPEVPTVQRACDTCHIGMVGTTNNIPVAPLNDQVHDACTQCHAINGTTFIVELVAPSGSVTTMNNLDGTASTSNGGGICTDCHSNYFEAHTHHDDILLNEVALKTGAPNPDESWAAAISCGDFAQGCHTDFTGDSTSLDTWTGIKWEHDRVGSPASNTLKDGLRSCATCHLSSKATADIWNYTDIPDVIATGTSVQCLNCHKQKEAPNGHGMQYIDHFIKNTVQGSLGYPPFRAPTAPGNAECIICHDTDLLTNGGPDVIVDVHNNSCTICHTNQPYLTDGTGGTPDLNDLAGLGTDPVGNYVCTDCHNDLNNTNFTYPFHGMTPGHTETQSRHDKTDTSNGVPYDCLACHTEMTPAMSDLLGRHMPSFTDENDCLVCHTGGATVAQTVVNAGTDAGGNTEQYCESCHTAKGAYRMHGLDVAGVTLEHDNLSTAGVGGESDCANCHSMGTVTQRLDVHVTPVETDHAGGCLPCHTAGTPASTQIVAGLPVDTDGGPVGSNLPQTCVACHTGSGVHLMHGADNASTAAIHDNVLGSSGSGATDCGSCHTGSTTQERLALHAACSTCHSEATTPATTVIANGWPNTGGAGQNCEGCHDAMGTYLLHGMTDAETAPEHNNITTSGFAGNDDCANCHAMGTLLAKIQLHTTGVQDGTPGDCLTCHQAAGKAATAITSGMSTGGNTAQTCFSCHELKGDFLLHGLTAGTSADVHDLLVNVVDVGVTSTCGTCHTSTTVQNRIEVHTLASTSCLTCHQWGGAVQTEIALGYNGTNNTPCEDCHSTAGGLPNIAYDWYSHTDPDHTSAGLNVLQDNTASTPTSADCVACHSAASQVAVHDTVAPAASPNVCAECHDTDSALKGSATVYTTGNFECNQCHTGGFDGHSHTHDVVQDATDLSGGSLCSTCHTDNSDASGSPLDSWTDIEGEHETGCTRCHDYTNGDAQGTPTVLANDTAIASAGTVKCLDCHTAKSAGHGGHDPSHFQWLPGDEATCGASACHDSANNTNVVGQVHGGTCALCHPTSGGRDGGKVGPNGYGDSTPAAAGNLDEGCIACHSYTGHLYGTDFQGAHTMSTPHNGMSVLGGCATTSCHTGDYITSVHDEGTDNGATYECLLCHTNLTNNGSPKSGTRGDASQATAGTDNCAVCHGATGAFNYDSAFQTAHQAKDHSDLTTIPSCITSGCHTGDYVTAVHDEGADSGATYECLLCHTNLTNDGALKSGTRGDASQGSGSCATCHGATGGFNYDSQFNTAHTRATDHDGVTSVSSNCMSSCHDGSSGPNIVNNTHTACGSCHSNTTNNGALVGAATNGTASGSGSCNSCHGSPDDYVNNFDTSHNKATPHDGVTVGTSGASCVAAGCHDQGNLITGVHDQANAGGNYSCLVCHNNDTTNGTFIAGSSAESAGLGTKECGTCHSGGHDAENDHDFVHDSWTIANGATAINSGGVDKNCHECHTLLGTPPYNFVGGIDQLHSVGAVDCLVCHGYDDQAAGANATATPQASVEAAITAGKGGTMQNCESCHVDVSSTAIPGHDAIAAHDYTIIETGNYESEGLSCSRCHHGNIAVEHVTGGALCEDINYTDQTSCENAGRFWKTNWGIAKGKIENQWDTPPGNLCTVCHDDGSGGPNASHTEIDNAITAGKGGTYISCFSCHNTSNTFLWQYDPDGAGGINPGDSKYTGGFTIPEAHHDSTAVDTGNCTFCHTDPRAALGNPTPAMLPCQECHAVEKGGSGDLLSIYKIRNRGQDINWTGSKVSGAMDWTYSFNALCSDSAFGTQGTCESNGGTWLPARPLANTLPSGTCTNATYNDNKAGCIEDAGGAWKNNPAWTDDNLAGSGVDHQWTVKTGGARGPGTVETYGMCIFCHKMGPYHAEDMAVDDTDSEVEDRNQYDDGYADGPFHPCTGRARLGVMHERAGYERQYYKGGTYAGSQKDTRGPYQDTSGNDDVPDATFHFEMVAYDPQRICSDKRWKNQGDCESKLNIWNTIRSTCSDPAYTAAGQATCEANTGTWDHGDQAYKYIRSEWLAGTMVGQTGAETEHFCFVPITSTAPTTETITDNGTAHTDGGNAAQSGASFSANVNASCTNSTCTVYLVYSGYYLELTDQGGGNWTGNTGGISDIGQVYGSVDIEFVAIDNTTRETLGNLRITGL